MSRNISRLIAILDREAGAFPGEQALGFELVGLAALVSLAALAPLAAKGGSGE
jgi:hypothetical protein